MESQQKKHIIIVAGEASGDMHAAHLVREIMALDPNITFSGVGGEEMRAAGVELYADLTKIAVVGFVEVLAHYAEFKRIFNLLLAKIMTTRADAVILVDYPGFNLRLAQALKKSNPQTKVIYYISPQVWAWKAGRVKLIKKIVDKMIVLFAFEKDFYARWGMDVDFVGHPLLDTVKITKPRESFLRANGLSEDRFTVALLPGSRKKEIEEIFPVMLKTAVIMSKEFQRIQFVVLKAATADTRTMELCLRGSQLPLKIISKQTYDGINAAHICMVASGTATLETAILQKPMVVIYKTSFITYTLARWFVKIPYIGLVNVVADKEVVPEFVQGEAKPEKIAAELTATLKNEIKIAQIKEELKKVAGSLGEHGASRRAAEVIIKAL